MILRICSKCKIEKPIECFQPDKSKKSGYKSQCKECIKNNPCRAEYLKNYRENHKNYYREKHAEYRSRNREKIRLESKKRREDNPELTKVYYQKNRDRILQYCHDYNQSEHGREMKARYRRSEKGKSYKTSYRARRRSSSGVMDRDITLEKLYNRSAGICALCGRHCDYEDYIFNGSVFIAGNNYPSIDHIKPLSKGGSHTWDNIQLAHKRCNSVKSNKIN